MILPETREVKLSARNKVSDPRIPKEAELLLAGESRLNKLEDSSELKDSAL